MGIKPNEQSEGNQKGNELFWQWTFETRYSPCSPIDKEKLTEEQRN
jgi:hypothetical protein